MQIDDALRALPGALERAGSPAPALLAPGADDATLASVTEALGFSLPDELVALHRWHDGLTGEAALFPGGYWLSLRQALDHRAALSRAAVEAVAGTDLEPSLIWRETWWPAFIDFAGNAHVIVCDEAGAPVWFVAGDDPADRRPAFAGVGALVAALVECWSEGVFAVSDGEVTADEERYAAILGSPGATADPASLEGLRLALTGGDAFARAGAARALGAARDHASGVLLTAAIDDPDPDVRTQAVGAIGRLRLEDGLERVIGVLADPDVGVRIAAAGALATFKAPASVAALVRALEDPVPDVRQLAADALARVKDPDAHAALAALVCDDDPIVRAVAQRRSL